MRRFLFAITAVVTVVLASLAACDPDTARTGAITCERVYRVCPRVIPAHHSEAAECADIFQGRCGAEMRQHIQCAMGKCDDAGAVDRVEVERACAATIEAYRRCHTGESDGGAEGSDEGQLPPFDAGTAPPDGP